MIYLRISQCSTHGNCFAVDAVNEAGDSRVIVRSTFPHCQLKTARKFIMRKGDWQRLLSIAEQSAEESDE